MRLEELPLPEINGSVPMDSGIMDLVRVLHAIELLDGRSKSCEGHIDPEKTPFPWVHLGIGYGKWGRIQEILDGYNAQSQVQWVLEGGNVCTEDRARDQDELEVLQESASDLANFIYENFC